MRKCYNSVAVIGLGFGDEGKGLTVNSLCRQLPYSLVIRYSGGQQAGHTVTLPDGRKHTFSNFGSGTFQGSPTYWSKHCTFDPVGTVKEHRILEEKNVHPILYVDERCPVTTPYDKLYNQTVSKALEHGTCGVGVGATFQREEKFYSLLVGDLRFPSVVKMKLALIRDYYGFDADCTKFLECCKSSVFRIVSGPPGSDRYIFEGSQGLLLDQNIGFFPHVTRSNTGSKNILQIIEEYSHIPFPTLFLITRAFQTRHGNGPMTNLEIPHNIAENPHEANVSNPYQGEFKRSLLDLDLLKYAIERDRYIRESESKHLVVTCLDLVQNELRFTNNSEIINADSQSDFVNRIAIKLGIWNTHEISSPDGEIKLLERFQKSAIL